MITSKNREDWRQVLEWANGRVSSVRLTQFWPFRQAYGVWEKYKISDLELEEQLQLVRQEKYEFNIIWPYNDLDILLDEYLIMDSSGRLFQLMYDSKRYVDI
ncbi:MAG: hypothetical protein Q7S46_03325 [Gallionella sp.]|nr:hypothetical protein [Gallionella sp.]